MNEANTKGLHVGVLSMQRVINYGSFLQAYALRQLLLQNGAVSVSFIDIKPGRQLNQQKAKSRFRTFSEDLLHALIRGKIVSFFKLKFFNERLRFTISSNWPLLKLDSPEHKSFDLAVIGSDEVFNCCQPSAWGYSTQLLGDIPPSVASRVVSFAASFGFTDIELMRQYGVLDETAKHLSSIDAISVRDENSRAIIKQLTSREPEVHLDPVLVYGYQQELSDSSGEAHSGDYLVVYTYAGRITDPNEIKAIKAYARKRKLKIHCIFCNYNWADKIVIPETPFDVLHYFRNASCIITDTFHGTIFSIITQSNFATFIRPSNRNKLSSLLGGLGLQNRAAERPEFLEAILAVRPDYEEADRILGEARAKANAYLKKCITLCNS